jgi:hypothetical protein
MKRGPKPLPEGKARVTLAVRVNPATKAAIEARSKATGKSQGKILDELLVKNR